MLRLRALVMTAGMFGILVAPETSHATAAYAAPVPSLPIAWGTCPDAWVGNTPGRLRDRLQCATIQAPLDHAIRDGRTLAVGVIRVRAGVPSQREGSIFFNPGGPGIHPGRFLRSIVKGWADTDASDPHEGSKRLLADRFDIVAVIPRGLVGSTEVRCLNGLPGAHAYVPTHLDDVNWGLMTVAAASAVRACATPAHAPYINTEQHVHDMDMVRRSLGDARIHIYGASYGGMIAAWYAANYPQNTGRMLLDSTLDFTHDYVTAVRLNLRARHDTIQREVVQPVLDNPARFGFGRDPQAVAMAIANLPSRIREVWFAGMESPVELAAALLVAPWWRDARPPSYDAMETLIQRAPITPDAGIADRIRLAARLLATKLYAPPRTTPLFADSPEGDSVRSIVVCNDIPWALSEQEIRARAQADATRYWSYTGDTTMQELMCLQWGGSTARQPDLATLEQASPFLMLQSDKDDTTPPSGAAHILERFPNAHLLMVRDSNIHGLFNFTLSPCIESTAANYLLTGALPDTPTRVATCNGTQGNAVDVIPSAPLRPTAAPVPSPAPAVHEEL
ncbi:alpha/beta fold hydrolase [Luteibacter sp. SG786]|uniref:alpha/beta hydrolase n=1 Tax=Luteibacter sp. SG786 TaxID=2587130 RepID=UPI00142462AA|nr:alpha/beta fold hydrolase [Luteibacter sp. SG786]NII55521.1 pimeloyl-ACP methyl ester carboxylesterase [Luteibacter sp. SG786]